MEREKARETQNAGGAENVDTLSETAGRNKLEGQELRGLRKSKKCWNSKSPNPSVHPQVAVISNLTQNLDGWVFEISRTLMPIMKTICSVSGNLEETYVWLDSACYDHVCGSSLAKDCGIIRNDEFSRQTDIQSCEWKFNATLGSSNSSNADSV